MQRLLVGPVGGFRKTEEDSQSSLNASVSIDGMNIVWVEARVISMLSLGDTE